MEPDAQKRLSYVEAAETALADLGHHFDAIGLNALRSVVSGYPDTGTTGAGEVAASLFMLLERLIADKRMDRMAVEIHVAAWRLLLCTEPNREATRVLIKDLNALRSHSTQAKAA